MSFMNNAKFAYLTLLGFSGQINYLVFLGETDKRDHYMLSIESITINIRLKHELNERL